jgi:membrane-bound lytic murein transglycosylase B
MPATWSSYEVDGDGDGRVDITDLEDSVSSAANYLCSNGARDPERLRNASWRYRRVR